MYKQLFSILLLGTVMLSGCQNQTSSKTTKEASTISTTSQQTKTSQKQTSQQSSATSQSVKTKQQTQVQSFTAAPTALKGSRIEQLNQQVKRQLGENILLPQVDGLADKTDNINVRAQGNSNNYSVYYSVGNQQRAFNDPILKNEIPYAALYKTTYQTAAQAKQQVLYRPAETGLPTVDLGYNLQGTVNSGAGQSAVHWIEGRWGLTVHAVSINGEDAKPLAKETVTTLEKNWLPIPNEYGAISLSVSAGYGQRPNIVTWQVDKVVYVLTTHDPKTAITLATHLK